MHRSEATFRQLEPGLGTGLPIPDGWRTIADAPLLIIVGVTGVGKSSAVEALAATGLTFRLLPNRRILTDELIIAHMQLQDGVRISQVVERTARFALTRRYRQQFPGGMAHALSQLQIDPSHRPALLLFDGLRGANEIVYAAEQLPDTRFVMLDAPDLVRVQRLCGRQDAFDQVTGHRSRTSTRETPSFASLDIPEASNLFSRADQDTMMQWVAQGEVTEEDLIAKLRIVIEERRNYDPAATRQALQTHASQRALIVDTVRCSPAQTARLIAAELRR